MREYSSRNVEKEINEYRVNREREEFKLAEKRVKIIGVFQMIAAIAILASLLLNIFSDSGVSLYSVILLIILIGLNAFAGYTAFKEMHRWYWLSILNQSFQIISISLGTLIINYSGIGGIYLVFENGVDFNVGLNANFSPGFILYSLNDELPFSSISIDLLALVFISALLTVNSERRMGAAR